jgi:hypothetical protein
MQNRQFNASSIWFSSLAGLLIAIGMQSVLDIVVPANSDNILGILKINAESLWASDTVIRFVSFIAGGFVSVLLARTLSISLIVLLLIVAVLATLFAQFPSSISIAWGVSWLVSAPIGALLGVWAAYAMHGVK